MSNSLVFFDFDGTLTKGDSLIPFLRAICGPIGLAMGIIRSAPFLIGYALGVISNDRAKEYLLRQTLRGRTEQYLVAEGAAFAQRVIPGMLRADTMQCLAEHLAAGDDCFLVSASLDLYLAPWAAQAGFSGVMCSRLEVDTAGRATGRLDGKNCCGIEKVSRVKKYLHEHALADRHTIAYGNSSGDFPLLCFSSESYLCKKKTISKIDKEGDHAFGKPYNAK